MKKLLTALLFSAASYGQIDSLERNEYKYIYPGRDVSDNILAAMSEPISEGPETTLWIYPEESVDEWLLELLTVYGKETNQPTLEGFVEWLTNKQ